MHILSSIAAILEYSHPEFMSSPKPRQRVESSMNEYGQQAVWLRRVARSVFLACLGAGLGVMSAQAEDALVATCRGTDIESSIAACTRLLDENPQPDIAVVAHQFRAFRLMSKGSYNEAVTDLNAALILRPDYYGLLKDRGNSYIALGKLDLATSDFDAALKLKPDFVAAYAGRSTVEYLAGDMDKAIADASEAIRLDPKQYAGYNNRGAARREKGDYEGAIKDLNIAVRLSPYASRPLYHRGLTLFRKGELRSALTDYEAAILLNPKEVDAVRGRTAVKALLGSTANATAAPPVAAAAIPSVAATVTPSVAAPPIAGSRPATVGTSWSLFTAKTLGVQLLVEKANNPRDEYTYEESNDWIDQRPKSDGIQANPTHFIRVLNKPAGQSIEDAIRETFIKDLPPEGRANCRVRPYVPVTGGDPGKWLFEIAPTGAYAQKIDRRFRDTSPTTQADGGCGDYGIGAAGSYFEFHPDENTEKYLYIYSGFEMTYDEKSIRILPGGPRVAAVSAPPPASAMPDDLAARIWSVSLNADPSGTLFCEAIAKGRTPEAGGDYSIRYRFETSRQGHLVVTYAGAKMRDVGDLVALLDGKQLGSFTAKSIPFGQDNAIVASVDAATFKEDGLNAFAKPGASFLQVRVGRKTFEIPVHGYASVNANLDACIGRLPRE